jgi:hypothetical protein
MYSYYVAIFATSTGYTRFVICVFIYLQQKQNPQLKGMEL